MPRITAEQERAVLDAIDAGELSRNQIARQLGIGAATVSRIAGQHGRALDCSRIKSMVAARRTFAEAAALFDQTAQLEAIHAAYQQWRTVIATTDKPAGVRDMAVALGILVDKHRLITGETTANVGHAHLHFTVIDNGRRSLPAPPGLPPHQGIAEPQRQLTEGPG